MTRKRRTTESGSIPPVAGQFRYSFDEDRWTWSDEVAQIHGYPSADAVVPTRELLLQHKHPDDKARVEALIDRIRTTREPFSSSHRIVTVSGQMLPVMVVADVMADDRGRPTGTAGFYVVLPNQAPAQNADSAAQPFGEQLDEVVKRRASIEQVKGALKLVYGLDDQQAFDLLAWRSQVTNTKLRDLAGAICDQLPMIALPSDARTQFDHLLLAAHESVNEPPAHDGPRGANSGRSQ